MQIAWPDWQRWVQSICNNDQQTSQTRGYDSGLSVIRTFASKNAACFSLNLRTSEGWLTFFTFLEARARCSPFRICYSNLCFRKSVNIFPIYLLRCNLQHSNAMLAHFHGHSLTTGRWRRITVITPCPVGGTDIPVLRSLKGEWM